MLPVPGFAPVGWLFCSFLCWCHFPADLLHDSKADTTLSTPSGKERSYLLNSFTRVLELSLTGTD